MDGKKLNVCTVFQKVFKISSILNVQGDSNSTQDNSRYKHYVCVEKNEGTRTEKASNINLTVIQLCKYFSSHEIPCFYFVSEIEEQYEIARNKLWDD